MARLKTLGFELRTKTSGIEFDIINTGTTTVTIDTTTFRSGSASMKIRSSSTASWLNHVYRGTSTNKIYVRMYVYCTLGVINNSMTILGLQDSGGADQGGGILLNTDNTLSLIGGSSIGFGTIGSPSPAMAYNAWNMVEISYDDSDANNLLEARLNGITFATGNGQEMSGGSTMIAVGFVDLPGGLSEVYFDDIAVNDSAGSFQNTWPGDAKILYLRPNAAGDANTFATQTGGTVGAANNFTRVNETTPDDATTLNGSSTLNQEDMFNFGDSGIGANDIINVVEVHGRFRNSTADATAALKFQLKKVASGTVLQSGAIVPNSTTFRTNVPSTTTPKTAAIVCYQDPDGGVWTQAELDSLQAGYKLTTGPGTAGRRVDVTNVWVIVEYIQKTPTRPPLVLNQAINRSNNF